MRKLSVLVLSVMISLVFSSCGEQKETLSQQLVNYMNDRYQCEFTVSDSTQSVKQNKTVLNLYLTTPEADGRQVLLRYTKDSNGNKTYIDNYPIIKNYNNILSILNSYISKYYSDYKICLNFYCTSQNSIDDTDISAEDILSNSSNGIRASIYIISDKSMDEKCSDIKAIDDDLEKEEVKFNSLYFAYFNKDFSYDMYTDDVTYAYAIDSISRADECKEYLIDEYYSYWFENYGEYKFAIKAE